MQARSAVERLKRRQAEIRPAPGDPNASPRPLLLSCISLLPHILTSISHPIDMASTDTSPLAVPGHLASALLSKTGLAPAAPALPSSYQSTPKTTPPLSPSLKAANVADEQLLLASQLLDEDAPGAKVALTGFRLTLGEVVAAARRGKEVVIDDAPAIKNRIDESVAFLKSKVSAASPLLQGNVALTLLCPSCSSTTRSTE